MISRTLSSLGAALVFAASPLLAQEAAPITPSPAFGVHQSFQEWNDANGQNWHTYRDVQTGYTQFLYGGTAAAAFEPRSDDDYFALGRLAIEDTAALHGIESGTLVGDEFHFLPLGLIGTTDKVTVQFRQEVGAVPVLGGLVTVLFTPAGELLSLQTIAMPGVAGLATSAAIGSDRAAKIAVAHFEQTLGLPGTLIGGPEKAIGQLETSAKSREARLIWEVDVEWAGHDMMPESFNYWIDARDGSVIRTESNIYQFDVGGTVNTMASPGALPDHAGNPEQAFPANSIRVSSSAGNTTTDSSGNFNIAGATGPLNVTFEYYGPWANVDNSSGGEYTLVTSLTATGNAVLMNPSPTELITAQANTLRWIGMQRDWVRAIDPGDSHLDFRAQANTNIGNNCNAYYNGSSVNFYTSGGGCVNTAYSTVVAHEMGHWHNVNYGTGNGSDGMGEGNADIWAMYLADWHIVGEDFFGLNGGDIRNGLNTRQFCGDSNPGCYGGVHADGEVWMGAAWKVRRNLNITHGNAGGDAIADNLFIGWMNAYNQTQIRSVIETQWLTLDDNDGNIDNGTPNYDDINDGFLAQGFPGYDLALITIANVTELADTVDEIGPYTVDATVTPLVAPTISGVDLFYSVSGGSFNTVAMTNTSGDNWTGDIPGQVSPASVEYYLVATDSLANTEEWPNGAPSVTQSFRIGIVTVFFFDDFEGGTNGWTHGQIATQDDWQQGVPQAKAGDPSSAASGTKIWANDLGLSGWNGEYAANVSNWLRSPVIDCTTATGTTLSFKRWLTVEKGIYDQATIKVNGTAIWSNAPGVDLLDSSWSTQEFDISTLADGNSSVQIQFSMVSDSGVEFGGWNLDDFELLSVGSSDGCTTPVKYGTGKISSLGYAPSISSTGTPSETIDDLVITIDLGIPGQAAILFSGAAADSVPFYGGLRLVSNPINREGLFYLDGWGSAAFPMPVPAGSAGTERFFQCWMRDPAHSDGTTVGMTDGLHVRYCD